MTAAGRLETSDVSPAARDEALRDPRLRADGNVVVVASRDSSSDALALRALSAAGLTPVPVRQLRALTDAVGQLRPDLVVLDIAICETEVDVVLAGLHEAGGPAVIVIGDLPDPATRAALLRAGADDCLHSPYLLDELLARAHAVLRRRRLPSRGGEQGGCLVAGSMRVDLDAHTVEIDGQPVELTVTEFRLLAYLVRHRGVALPRTRLLADVWGYTVGTLDTVTVHVRRLRTKIETDPSRPAWIETVWGVGYRFAADSRRPPGPGSVVPLS